MRRTGLLSLSITIWLALLSASSALAAQRVLGWGWHSGGEVSPVDVPTPVSGIEDPVSGAAGGYFNLVLLADGTVTGWGSGASGELGPNPAAVQHGPPIEGLSEVQAVAASNSTSYALLNDGTVKALGRGREGQLGNGTTTEAQSTPVEVSGLEDVKAIAGGGFHALALLEDGTVVQWGGWYKEEVGPTTPVAVAGLTNVKAIALGEHAAYALLEDGTVKAWGYNEDGALGTGAAPGKVLNATPTAVSGLTEVKAITAGGNSAVALREDGTVLDWGNNEDGKLGTGTYAASNVPVSVKGISEAKAVAMGPEMTLALLQDGSLHGWGGGGAAGTGEWGQFLTPVAVCGGTGVSAVFAGGHLSGTSETQQSSAFAFASPEPLCPRVQETKPGWGKPGTTVTLKGVNLDEVNSVLFGGSPASFTVKSPTEIRAVAPPGSGEVQITGTSLAGGFGPYGIDGPEGLFDYVEAPSFGRCVTSVEAEFSNNLCTTPGSGKGYEWDPLSKGGFASESKKPIVFETGGVKVSCKTETGTGALTSNKTAGSLVWTLAGCERLGQPCTSSGAPSGSIVTEALQGSLAIYKPGPKGNKVKDKAGLVISPVASGGPVAQFVCGGTSITIDGSVIGQLATNKQKPTLKLKFAVKKGAQEPSAIPGGPTAVLSASVGGGPEQATTLVGSVSVTIQRNTPVGVNTIAFD
ncbi:MAG TPA: IPT/TIG domain-containing protein [Solirubrobacteraceae bacterium]|nr:IPT/TIG domain-containing protein [Solirubrobacteraceae bacterium]